MGFDLKEFLVRHRNYILFVLLPFMLFYRLVWFIFTNYLLWKHSDPTKHLERVKYVQKQVREWQVHGKGRKMCTARPQWMTVSPQHLKYKSKSYQVEVNLMDILKIDEVNQIVRVEPMVSIGRLLDYLVPKGWVVPIVPELYDLTVGGLVMGGGIETTSHKYGLWQHICTKFEIVTADGTLLECTKEKNSDLYWAIPWSYGTFGFLVAVEIMIIPYKPYVRLEYQPAHTLDEGYAILTKETHKNSGNDSVESLLFSKEESVVMTGTFVDDYEPGKLNEIGKYYKPWFYTHVKKYLENGRGYEYIPTLDFYFRHNRSTFWMANLWAPFGNNVIFRHLAGYLLPYDFGFLRFLNTKLPADKHNEKVVIQDYGFSLPRFKDVVTYCDGLYGIYPVWICPLLDSGEGPVKSKKEDMGDISFDIGIYGPCEKKDYEKEKTLKTMEQYVLDNNGYLGLYAETFMTYEQFRAMFDGSHYMKVRQQIPLTEEAFPEVYEKISKIGRS